jgi:hypothetical protein
MTSVASPAAARSLHVFGCYLVLAGVPFLAAPSLAAALLGLPPPMEPWVRLVGVLAVALGTGDIVAARSRVGPCVRWSVWRRLGAAVAMAALVALGLTPPPLLLLAAVDAAAAGWTAWALRGDGASQRHRLA